MWRTVKNGNYYVSINLNDGTKIRFNDENCFKPDNVENIDLKITNHCSDGCAFCYENSCPNGKHGDLLHLNFIDTMLPYSEISIGGGDIFEHPDLIKFLYLLKEKNLIANITVSQNSFLRNYRKIVNLVQEKLVYGIGVSIKDINDDFLFGVKNFSKTISNNIVLHVINGIISLKELKSFSHQDFKILILGYKNFRRGEEYYIKQKNNIDKNKIDLYNNLPQIIKGNEFSVISFDNLAIKQLEPHRAMSKEEWDKIFLGDDGFTSMYIDAVNRQFAKSSISEIRHPLLDNMQDMHRIIFAE